ncbi:MAG TPA: DUF488 domain-containing protein [Stellaceae bacterium]|nr:DUF488 domain-containing protein [Stellaceae bacterium]
MTTATVFTIGYERAAQADVLAALKATGVTLLVDVRDRPQSRRAGFSKRQLAASAEAIGIAYLHLKALGTPPEGREAHHTGDQARFWRIVDEQLAKPEAGAALDELAEAAGRQTACLLCYEADWRHCHRARIAERLEARGFDFVHLTAEPRFA